jgi:cell division protein FtsB
VLASLVAAILVAAIFPVKELLSTRSQIAELNRQTQLLEQQNSRLERRIARLHDPTSLERMARECLGMVKPGEVSFVVVPKGGRGPKPASC